ncbi:hypothetical protein Pse7367_3338 [Thalassoporum mexicanum PCC 7367]|uniref:hypothetical protein n=1 Tax=Thalassoporum mexicanum TaxID=3457544 RepID=UPI00029F91A5|nr:hypothetical protein [Pseudanabaena sp. PCC 7367]AFY71578.1 hypothetical protein Pse7367_3338 [Pseudanabaena sp. PCC 7367]
MDISTSITKFGGFEEAAGFLLEEAFRYVYRAAHYEMAEILFGERIWSVNPKSLSQTFSDDPMQSIQTLTEYLANRDDVDSLLDEDEDISELSKIWDESQVDALKADQKLSKDTKINAIDIVGHIINLSTCLEAVVNRHLFLQLDSGKLQKVHYNSIDRIELVPKILFLFKKEILDCQINITRIKQLIKLRNKAVHFKHDSRESIAPSVEELLGIWDEFGQIMALVDGEPTQELVLEYKDAMIEKWFE